MGSLPLSICIPTYNFGAFIGQTLTSIISQATDDVEIVVVDGASTDNTEEVVRGAQAVFPRLSYHRRETNMGVDRDLAKAVELAEGDYCWLMSSDDVIRPSAIQIILSEIQHRCDVYLCNRTECDSNLIPIRDRPWLSRTYADPVFHFSANSDWINYFNQAKSIGALFSYISSIIVSREKWNIIGWDERTAGSNYAHVFRIFSILNNNGALKYIKDPLVLCRGRNDSFSSQGLTRRILIDLNGYELLASRLFDEEAPKSALKYVMRREHPWFMLARLPRNEDAQQWQEFEQKLIVFGYSRWNVFLLRLFSSLRPLVALARGFRNLLISTKVAIRRSF